MTCEINYFEELDALRQAYPALTFQNDGYENIPKDVRAANQEGHDKIEAILKETVSTFVRFQNFKASSDGRFYIRCQTRWDERFTGVHYFPLEDFKPDSPTWKQEDWPDIPDTPEQRALIKKTNAEVKARFPILVSSVDPIEGDPK